MSTSVETVDRKFPPKSIEDLTPMDLLGIPVPILEDMRRTLMGTAPILVERWLLVKEDIPRSKVESAEERVNCGCLMMDNHVDEFLKAAKLSDSFTNLSESGFMSRLYVAAIKRSRKYKTSTYKADIDRIQKYALSFDKWATQYYENEDGSKTVPYAEAWLITHGDQEIRRLSAVGRKELLKQVRAQLKKIKEAQKNVDGYTN